MQNNNSFNKIKYIKSVNVIKRSNLNLYLILFTNKNQKKIKILNNIECTKYVHYRQIICTYFYYKNIKNAVYPKCRIINKIKLSGTDNISFHTLKTVV